MPGEAVDGDALCESPSALKDATPRLEQRLALFGTQQLLSFYLPNKVRLFYLSVDHWQVSVLESDCGLQVCVAASSRIVSTLRQESPEAAMEVGLPGLSVTLVVDGQGAVQGAASGKVQRHQTELKIMHY